MMKEEWEQALEEAVGQEALLQATFSGAKGSAEEEGGLPPRTVVRPVRLKAGLRYQFEKHYPTKVLHENVEPGDAAGRMAGLLRAGYRQALVKTKEADLQVLISKKEKPRCCASRRPARRRPTLRRMTG